MSESSLINRRQYSALYKILAVIVGLRNGLYVEGERQPRHSGMFGMFSVAAFMTLLILAIFGDRKRIFMR